MSEFRSEQVDIDSLVSADDGWELRVYQTPSVLLVRDSGVARSLQEALSTDRAVDLTWDPDTCLVSSCRLA